MNPFEPSPQRVIVRGEFKGIHRFECRHIEAIYSLVPDGTSRAFAYSYSQARASTLRKEHIYRSKRAGEHVSVLSRAGEHVEKASLKNRLSYSAKLLLMKPICAFSALLCLIHRRISIFKQFFYIVDIRPMGDTDANRSTRQAVGGLIQCKVDFLDFRSDLLTLYLRRVNHKDNEFITADAADIIVRPEIVS